jgi:hypothetical protein
MIPELVAQYVDFTMSVKNSNTLGEPVKAQIMLQMAQALNALVPLAGGQQDQVVQQQHEMDMAQQKHTQDMQIQMQKHQAELQKADDKHRMDLVHQAEKHQANLEMMKEKSKQVVKKDANNQR